MKFKPAGKALFAASSEEMDVPALWYQRYLSVSEKQELSQCCDRPFPAASFDLLVFCKHWLWFFNPPVVAQLNLAAELSIKSISLYCLASLHR